jgi:hypothetical protein
MRLIDNPKSFSGQVLFGLGGLLALLAIYIGVYAGPLVVMSAILLPAPFLSFGAMFRERLFQGAYRKYLIGSYVCSFVLLFAVFVMTLLSLG